MHHRFRQVIFSPRILGAAVLVFIFVPIPDVNTFARLISSAPPLGALFFVLGFLGLALNTSDRRLVRWLTLLSLLTVLVGILIKVDVASSENIGFKACYQIQSPLDPDGFRDGVCEATYNWTTPAGSSRLDSTIDFRSIHNPSGPGESFEDTNWDLSAINHLVYNYYAWDPTKPERERLPLDAYWVGKTEDLRPMMISYTGEGNIRSADNLEYFVPTYVGTNELIIDERPSQDIEVFFRWNPPSDFADAPFAAIRITDTSGKPIRPAVDPRMSFLLGVLAVIVSLAATAIVINFLSNIRMAKSQFERNSTWLAVLTIFGLSWAANLISYLVSGAIWFPPLSMVSLFVALVAAYVTLGQPLTRIVAALGISLTSVSVVLTGITRNSSVPVLQGGSDFLSYESFAREILITGSLRAGEDVFWFAPGIRYTLYFLHTAFGDGGLWLWVIALCLTLAAFAFSILWLMPNRSDLRASSAILRHKWRAAVLLASLVSIGLMAGSDVVWRAGWILFSEFPTWPAIAVAFALSVKSRGSSWLLISVGLLLGFSVFHRSNQMLGALAIAAVAIWVASDMPRKARGFLDIVNKGLLVLVPFGLVAGLVPLHNWVYGRRLVFTHDPSGLQYNIAVSPSELLESSEAWAALARQMQGLVVWPANDFPIPYDDALALSEYATFGSPMGWSARFALLALLIAGLAVFTGKFATRRSSLLLFVVPGLFFAPHIFLNLSVAYPRHVVVGYLTMALAALALAARGQETPAALSVRKGATSNQVKRVRQNLTVTS